MKVLKFKFKIVDHNAGTISCHKVCVTDTRKHPDHPPFTAEEEIRKCQEMIKFKHALKRAIEAKMIGKYGDLILVKYKKKKVKCELNVGGDRPLLRKTKFCASCSACYRRGEVRDSVNYRTEETKRSFAIDGTDLESLRETEGSESFGTTAVNDRAYRNNTYAAATANRNSALDEQLSRLRRDNGWP